MTPKPTYTTWTCPNCGERIRLLKGIDPYFDKTKVARCVQPDCLKKGVRMVKNDSESILEDPIMLNKFTDDGK